MANAAIAANADLPDEEPAAAAAPKAATMLSLIVAMLAVTVLGMAVGGAFGFLLLPNMDRGAPGKPEASSSPGVKGRYGANANLRALPPIVTNLAAPEKTWVRLEASLVMEGEQTGETNVLAAQITEDLIAFLRTVSLAQIEGASGFQHLREDMSDRIRVRSGGKVRDLVVQTFIVE